MRSRQRIRLKRKLSCSRKARSIDMKEMLAREDISKEKPKHVNEERFKGSVLILTGRGSLWISIAI